MKAPKYGWLTGLTDYMNREFPEKWAYTGSFAMYCHASARNTECREPGDIDIVVPKVSDVWFKLRAALDGKQSGPPGMATQKAAIEGAKLYVDGTDLATVKIDVLAAGGKFGKLDDVIIYHQQTTILRVLSLTALLRTKQLIVDDDDDDDGKAAGDIVFIKSLPT